MDAPSSAERHGAGALEDSSWEDVTDVLFSCSSALPVGGLLCAEGFRMADACNAIELMEKKLDFAADRSAMPPADIRLTDGSLPLLELGVNDVLDIMDTLFQLETLITCLYTHPVTLQTLRAITGRAAYQHAAAPSLQPGMPGLAALQRLPEPAPPVAAVALPAAAPGSLQWAVLSALLAFVTSTLKSVALTHRLVHVADLWEDDDFQSIVAGCDLAWSVPEAEVAALLCDAETALLALLPPAFRTASSLSSLAIRPFPVPIESLTAPVVCGGGSDTRSTTAAAATASIGGGDMGKKSKAKKGKGGGKAGANSSGGNEATATVYEAPAAIGGAAAAPTAAFAALSLANGEKATLTARTLNPALAPLPASLTVQALTGIPHSSSGGDALLPSAALASSAALEPQQKQSPDSTENTSTTSSDSADGAGSTHCSASLLRSVNALVARLRYRRAYLSAQVSLSWSRRAPSPAPFAWGGIFDLPAAASALEVAWQLMETVRSTSRLTQLHGLPAAAAAAPAPSPSTSTSVPGVFPGYEKTVLQHGTPRLVPLPSHAAAFSAWQRHIANMHLLCNLPAIASHDPARPYIPSDAAFASTSASDAAAAAKLGAQQLPSPLIRPDDEELVPPEVRTGSDSDYCRRVIPGALSTNGFIRSMCILAEQCHTPAGAARVPLGAMSDIAARLSHDAPPAAPAIASVSAAVSAAATTAGPAATKGKSAANPPPLPSHTEHVNSSSSSGDGAAPSLQSLDAAAALATRELSSVSASAAAALISVPYSGIFDPPMDWFACPSSAISTTPVPSTSTSTTSVPAPTLASVGQWRHHVSLNGVARFLELFSQRAPDVGVRSLAFTMLLDSPTVAETRTAKGALMRVTVAEVEVATGALTGAAATIEVEGTPLPSLLPIEAAAASEAAAAASSGSVPPPPPPSHSPEDVFGDFDLADGLSAVVLGSHTLCEVIRGSMLSAGVHPEALISSEGRRFVHVLSSVFYTHLKLLCHSRLRMRRRMNNVFSDWAVILDDAEALDSALAYNFSQRWSRTLQLQRGTDGAAQQQKQMQPPPTTATAATVDSPHSVSHVAGIIVCMELQRAVTWALDWTSRLELLHTQIGAECDLFATDEGCSLYWVLDHLLLYQYNVQRELFIRSKVLSLTPECWRLTSTSICALEADQHLQLYSPPSAAAAEERDESASTAAGAGVPSEPFSDIPPLPPTSSSPAPDKRSGGGSGGGGAKDKSLSSSKTSNAAPAAASGSVRSAARLKAEAEARARVLSSYMGECKDRVRTVATRTTDTTGREIEYIQAQRMLCQSLFRVLSACKILGLWRGLDVDDVGASSLSHVRPGAERAVGAGGDSTATNFGSSSSGGAPGDATAGAAAAAAPSSALAAAGTTTAAPAAVAPPRQWFRNSRLVFESRWRDLYVLPAPRRLDWDMYVDTFLRLPSSAAAAVQLMNDADKGFTAASDLLKGVVDACSAARCSADAAALFGTGPGAPAAAATAAKSKSALTKGGGSRHAHSSNGSGGGGSAEELQGKQRMASPSSADFLSSASALTGAQRLMKVAALNRAFLMRLAGESKFFARLSTAQAPPPPTLGSTALLSTGSAAHSEPAHSLQLSRLLDPVFAAVRLPGVL